MHPNLGSFVRFLITGGINSAASYGVYLALSWLLPYQAAYAVGYFAGIGLSYMLQCRFVFTVRPNLRTFCVFPLIYVVQYGVSAALLEWCIQWLGVSVPLAPLLVMVIVAPATFVASKLLLTYKKGPTMPATKYKQQLSLITLATVLLLSLTILCMTQSIKIFIEFSEANPKDDYAQLFINYGDGFSTENSIVAPIKIGWFLNREAELTVPLWQLYHATGIRLDPVANSKVFSVDYITYKSIFGKHSSKGKKNLEYIAPLSGMEFLSASDESIRYTNSTDPQFALTRLFDSMHAASVRFMYVCSSLIGLTLVAFAFLLRTCVRSNIRGLDDLERVLELQKAVDRVCTTTKIFCTENWKLFLFIFLTGIFVYGYDITNLTFSIDEELQWQGLHLDDTWLSQGRWGIVFFRNLLLPFIEYPFISSIVSIFFVAASYTLFISKYTASFTSKCVFGAVAISSPIYAYIQSFSIMNAYVGASMFLCAAAYRMFVSAYQDKMWGWLWGALSLLVLAIATYQTFIFVFIAFLLVDGLILSFQGHANLRMLTRRIVTGSVFSGAAAAMYFCINASMVNLHSEYVDGFIKWHELSFAKLQWILDSIFAFYSGSLHIAPEMPYLVAAGVLIVFSSKQKWLTAVMTFLVLAYMQSLNLVFFHVLPLRMFLQIPLCSAGLIFLLTMNRLVLVRAGIVAAVFFIVCFHASTVTRLFLADTFQRAADEQIATRVINAMYDACPDFSEKDATVAFIGFIPEVHSKLRFTDDTFGSSFWLWDNDSPYRKAFHIFSLGIQQFPLANREQQRIARDIAKTMPCWPEKGFVQYRDGLLIVHLSPVEGVPPTHR